jgi:hypothetical protein
MNVTSAEVVGAILRVDFPDARPALELNPRSRPLRL